MGILIQRYGSLDKDFTVTRLRNINPSIHESGFKYVASSISG